MAQAAHRWAGASSIEGLPDVERVARTMEDLAEENRLEQAARIRADLRCISDQYQKVRGVAAS